jgi:hypothetical protein
MTRPDGPPRQYLHLTQILYSIEVDSITGLSKSYQILIRFDTGYNEMRKEDVQEARHYLLLLRLQKVYVCDEGVSDWWIIELILPMEEA